ncbi:MAG: TonB-dependent receptor [Bacteroidales bacterium]|nr:TonB-dependent receptor [Bacteroidales bacterium]
MKIKNIVWLFIALILISSDVIGQKISGIVYEMTQQKKKVPLPGVNLYWLGTQQGTISDEEGKFELNAALNNSNLLVASFVGYLNDTLEINNNEKSVEILLSNNKTLDEFVVTGKQSNTFVSQIDPLYVQTITGAELSRAACCNLSESFETNASVDVAYSDAVSGAKKIELLGLHGKYSQMMTENIPNLRGLSTTYGLGYIPGTWMESIQVSKGTSSVVNGYESITGQINIEYKKPDTEERLFLNAYVNHIGKLEGNFNGSIKLNNRWSTMLYLHGENLNNKVDHNGDSFVDEPLVKQYHVFNRWKYAHNNYMAQFGVQLLDEDRTAGQVEFDKTENPENSSYYGINIRTKRYQAWGKTGYIFNNNSETSLGFINSYTYHDQSSFFGLTRYNGSENTYYANLILQSEIGSHKHKYSTGLSYLYDVYKESLNDSIFNRMESVPGVFFQYTYSNEKNLTLLLGVRSDFHNLYGTFITPRVHVKYNFNEHTILRSSIGKGYRSANIIAENSYLLASSRNIIVKPTIKQEEAWNYGINLTQIFNINDRDLNINIEFYRTDFVNQVVVDRDQSVSEINIYNLDGKSFSNSYQIEAVYELIPRLDVVAAFRYNDVQMTISNKLEREPLVNRYKGLFSLAYKTNLDKWQFDFTTQLNGDARLPDTRENPAIYQRPENSPVYTIMNVQVTKNFRKWNIYLGVENLTDFKQHDPVIAADDPFGPHFDSSIVWGPIMGRKFYGGIKYWIN